MSCLTITRAIDPKGQYRNGLRLQQTSHRLHIEISLHITCHYILVATISNSIFSQACDLVKSLSAFSLHSIITITIIN